MVEASEERVKQRARELWELAGHPGGRDEEFWLQAERELKSEAEAGHEIRNDLGTKASS